MARSAPIQNAHDTALAAKHAELEARIAREAMRPNPDAGVLARLKKAKLRIKDALFAH
jgi:hypothetical protein